jgi:hypothetical protein
MMLTIEGGAVTRGSGLRVHSRLADSPRTLCGYVVASVLNDVPVYRIPCPRCAAYLARVG